MSKESKGISNCYVFKSRLQEYTQKVDLTTPVYETIREGPSHQPYFKSTVIIDDMRFDSLPGFSNRKAAEQSAAEIALLELSKRAMNEECISQPVHETGLCKNLLQEYAQKMNYAIPLYECKKKDTPGKAVNFFCTVDIGGTKYVGAAARTKKEAEIKAARTALLAIQSITSDQVENPNGEPRYTVVPCKRKEPEIVKATVKLPKRARLQKKTFKKRAKNCLRAAQVHRGSITSIPNVPGYSHQSCFGPVVTAEGAPLVMNQIPVVPAAHAEIVASHQMMNFNHEQSNLPNLQKIDPE